MDKWLKPLGFLVIFILIFSIIGRLLSGGETLSEYADKNPEIAYATPQKTATPTPSPIQGSPQADAETAMQTSIPANMSSDVPTDLSNGMPAESSSPSMIPAMEEAFFIPLEEESGDSTHYQEGFFFQPLSDTVTARITGISYPVSEHIAPALSIQATNIMSDSDTPAISYDDLRYMNVLYYDFQGEVQTGELICNKNIAQDLVEIFYELYLNEYQIEKIRLIDEYGGDDTASMEDNNTSCFNYRVVDGTSSLSKHALGCAIDINPFYNPYVVFNRNGSGETYISPKGSETYADRSLNFPYKIDENDLCYKLFKEHGFTWGGNWNSSKDYQHFQKVVE